MENRALTPANIPHAIDVAQRNSMRSLTRACRVVGLRNLSHGTYDGQRNLSHGSYAATASKILADDRTAAELLTRAASPPATLAGNSNLQHIVYAFLDALTPFAASSGLISRSVQLNFNSSAEIIVPNLAMPLAAWVGDSASFPVQQGVTTTTALTPYKLGVIVTLTNEMLLSSNSETMVRDALLDNVGIALDAFMFSTTAGIPAKSPPGLLYGVAPTAATTGGGLAAMVGDIQALTDTLKGIAGNGQIVLIAAAKQSVALAMLPPSPVPYPVLTSSQLAAGTVVAVATQALLTSVEAPTIEVSSAPSFQARTDPVDDLLTGGTVHSGFQTDSVALRFRLPATWALRSSGVAYITGATW